MSISREQFRDRIVQHKLSVQVGMQRIAEELFKRGIHHDDDKFVPEIFEQLYNGLDGFSNVDFCSMEHEEAMKSLKPSIDIHYGSNDHHPQHFENGINGMDLLSLMEMIVDWKSAHSAYGKGDFFDSMKKNKERFGIDEQLFAILVNTAKNLGYIK